MSTAFANGLFFTDARARAAVSAAAPLGYTPSTGVFGFPTWPAANAAGALTNDGSGGLTWLAVSSYTDTQARAATGWFDDGAVVRLVTETDRVVLAAADQDATPIDGTLQAQSASLTNTAGGSLLLAAGQGRGNALSGRICFMYSPVGGSGGGLNALAEAGCFGPKGVFGLRAGTTPDVLNGSAGWGPMHVTGDGNVFEGAGANVQLWFNAATNSSGSKLWSLKFDPTVGFTVNTWDDAGTGSNTVPFAVTRNGQQQTQRSSTAQSFLNLINSTSALNYVATNGNNLELYANHATLAAIRILGATSPSRVGIGATGNAPSTLGVFLSNAATSLGSVGDWVQIRNNDTTANNWSVLALYSQNASKAAGIGSQADDLVIFNTTSWTERYRFKSAGLFQMLVNGSGGGFQLGTDVFGYRTAAALMRLVGGLNISKAHSQDIVTLTDAATVTPDASASNHFRWTIGGNRTLNGPTNPVDGQLVRIEIKQDGTGSRLLTLASGAGNWAFGTDVTSVTLSTTIGATDILMGIYNATANRWWVITMPKGFA